jgi:DNA-binding FadR family transcriptional regulator
METSGKKSINASRSRRTAQADAAPEGPARAKLGRLKVLRSYDALAEILRESILDGEYAEGTALPPEREIVDETGLSRGSVREALRRLEVEGLIVVKTGRYGGSIVRRPDENTLSHFIHLFVRGRKVSLGELNDARGVLEPGLAYLAAMHRDAKDIETLQKATRKLEKASLRDDPETYNSVNLEWHLAVARASGNQLLGAYLAAISHAIQEQGRLHKPVFDPEYEPEIEAAVLRAHQAVTSAIIAGDPAAARRRMERHINAYAGRTAPLADKSVSIE